LKLCDRCFRRGDTVKSVETVKFYNTEELFDLCESCSQIIREICTGTEKEKDK